MYKTKSETFIKKSSAFILCLLMVFDMTTHVFATSLYESVSSNHGFAQQEPSDVISTNQISDNLVSANHVSSNQVSNQEEVQSDEFELTKTEITLLKRDSEQLTCVPESSTLKTTFQSVNDAVAIVDENGLITATGIGDTSIYVTRAGIKKEVAIHVISLFKSVQLQKEQYTFDLADDTNIFSIPFSVLPYDASDLLDYTFEVRIISDPESIIQEKNIIGIPTSNEQAFDQGQIELQVVSQGNATIQLQAQKGTELINSKEIEICVRTKGTPEIPSTHFITNLYSNRTIKQFYEQSGFREENPEWTFNNPEVIVTADNSSPIQKFAAHFEPETLNSYGFDMLLPISVTTVTGIKEESDSVLTMNQNLQLVPTPKVTGADLESQEYTLSYATLTKNLALVSESGLVTPLAVGNAKIRITMRLGNKSFTYDKTIKIVREREVTDITIMTPQDSEYQVENGVMIVPYEKDKQIPLEVLFENEPEDQGDYTAGDLDWITSDSSVAQFQLYNGKPVIVLNNMPGMSVITAKYVTDKKTKDYVSDSVRIVSKDYMPRIDEIYTYDYMQDTIISVMSEVDLTDAVITLRGREISNYFSISRMSGSIGNLYAFTAKDHYDSSIKNPILPNGTYTGSIDFQVYDSDAGVNVTYCCPLKIRVKRAKPDAAIKIISAPNLFYRDAVGSFTVTGKDADKLRVKNIYNSYYDVSYDPDTRMGNIIQKEDYIDEHYSNIPSSVLLAIPVSYEGYDEKTAQTFYLSVKTKKNKAQIKSSPPTISFYPEQNIKTDSIKLTDQTYAGNSGEVTSIKFADSNASYISKIGIPEKLTEDGIASFSLIGNATLNQVVKFRLSNPNWRDSVVVSQKFVTSNKKPTLIVSKTELKLNRLQAAQAGKVSDSMTYSIKNHTQIDKLGTPHIYAMNAYARTLLCDSDDNQESDLLFTYDLSRGQIQAHLTNSQEATGSAKFKVRFYLDEKQENTDAVYIEKTFTVRVMDQTPTVTVSKKGKIDLLDPESGVIVTPKINHSNLPIRDFKLSGAYADLFTLTQLEGSDSFLIQVRTDDDFEQTVRSSVRAGKTYKLKVAYHLKDSSQNEAAFNLTVNVTQSAPAVSASGTSITMFNAYAGKTYGKDLSFTSIRELQDAKLLNETDLFLYDAEEQKLYLNDSISFKKGQNSKNYVLKFQVPYKYAASNKKAKVVNVKVKLIR